MRYQIDIFVSIYFPFVVSNIIILHSYLPVYIFEPFLLTIKQIYALLVFSRLFEALSQYEASFSSSCFVIHEFSFPEEFH